MEVPPAPPASNNEEDLGKLLNARMVSGPGRRIIWRTSAGGRQVVEEKAQLAHKARGSIHKSK